MKYDNNIYNLYLFFNLNYNLFILTINLLIFYNGDIMKLFRLVTVHFAELSISPKSVSPKSISSKPFHRMSILPNVHFTEWPFHRNQ
jgi:hypothetical protein